MVKLEEQTPVGYSCHVYDLAPPVCLHGKYHYYCVDLWANPKQP